MGTRSQTHCVSGHPLTPENVRWVGSRRQCIACQRLRTKLHDVYKRGRKPSGKRRPGKGLQGHPGPQGGPGCP